MSQAGHSIYYNVSVLGAGAYKNIKLFCDHKKILSVSGVGSKQPSFIINIYFLYLSSSSNRYKPAGIFVHF